MPDFNQYATKTPYIRPELPSPGISLIAYPKLDFSDKSGSGDGSVANSSSESAPETDDFEKNRVAAARRQKLLGIVPITPGASTDYKIAKKYNDPSLGFVGGRDNEDLYAQNQGFFNSVGTGLLHFPLLTATKLGTGLGYLAGLVGVDNDPSKYGGGFSGWIAGASDNAFAKWFAEQEDNVKNDWLPIYKKASESQHGFFRHMGDLDFWTDDLTDGLAFVASSYVPGIAISKLKIGANVVGALQKMRGIGYAEEAAALSTEGVEGVTTAAGQEEAGQAAKAVQEGSKDFGRTLTTNTDKMQEIAKAIPRINNAALARSVDVGTTSFINTASQAMFNANDAKNNTYNTLMEMKDETGKNKYTEPQAKIIAAKVAKDTYLMNLAALGLMNLYEANFIFKKAPEASRSISGDITTKGLFSDATLAEKTFGERAASALKEPAKGFVTGGLWLGNMQLAIDRLNQNPENFDLDFSDKLSKLGKEYIKQTGAALTGNDPEAAKALGVGGALGAGLGKILGENNAAKKSLSDLNSQMSAFKSLDGVYKIDPVTGKPTIDNDKLRSWVASANKILNLQEVSRNLEAKNAEVLAKIYKDEIFSRFAKAHFDAGLGDLLYKKLGDLANIKDEDLALLGYDPASKDGGTPDAIAAMQKKAQSLENLYNNIRQNFVTRDFDMNTKAGQKKVFDITDKMFYLSARSESIGERIRESDKSYMNAQNNADSYNADFNSLSDATVAKYNQLFENLEAAKRRSEGVQRQQDHIDYLNREVEYQKNGIYAKSPAPIERIRKQNRNVHITLPSPKENFEALVADKQKALDEFVKNNKETLEKMKKDSRGRYMFEVANKNLLPAAKEMERHQIAKSELSLAQDATLNVLSRLADPVYGTRYYDEVYSKVLDRHAAENNLYSDLVSEPNEPIHDVPPETKKVEPLKKVDDSEIKTALEEVHDNGKPKNVEAISEHLAEKISTGEKLTDEEEEIRRTINEDVEKKLQEKASKSDDTHSEKTALEREREALEQKPDRSPDEEDRLDELNRKIDALDDLSEKRSKIQHNEHVVESSENIAPEKKPDFKKVLNDILVTRGRVQKTATGYLVDGQEYRKVTDLIGDTVPDALRDDPKVASALNAGNTIDALVKDYFKSSGIFGDDFKAKYADNISEDGFNNVIKALDKIRKNFQSKGIEILDSNVFVIDPEHKVAGEIDLIGVDPDGKFKIFEIQARRGDVYRRYGKEGVGVKIRDIDSKRLSMYRNMFANQYGEVPNEISVKFPFEVKYDKTNALGFIDDAKLRDPIRFEPKKNVEIKMKGSEPVRIGSKFNSIDMGRIFFDTFLPDKLQKDKLKFLFRNMKFEDIKKGIKLVVSPADTKFQENYKLQAKALNKEDVGYNIKKFTDYRNKDEFGNPKEFDNLYSLVGNTDAHFEYEGANIGYLSPVQTMAYKDENGNFKILDESTDAETYARVTGNDVSTYGDFKRSAEAYKKIHNTLTDRLAKNDNKPVTLSASEVNDLFDMKVGYGELDKVKSKDTRPLLKDLSFFGVRSGPKQIPTVVDLDANGNAKVYMDKGRTTPKLIKKYQEVDRWANANIDKIQAAITDRDGTRVSNQAAIIETPNGEYKLVSLKAKEGFDINNEDDFVNNLGEKFTAAVNKGVFKNESIMAIPKASEEVINIEEKSDAQVVANVYPGQDVEAISKLGLPVEEYIPETTETKVDEFLKSASPELRQDLEDMGIHTREAIINDYQNGEWSNIQDYIDDLKNCR